MSALPRTVPGVRKEVRALLSIWGACVLTVAAAAVLEEPVTLVMGAMATYFGLITLGAQSFGHDYTYRTLPLLLAQPVDRRRVYLIKYGVLAAMVLMLALFAWRVQVGVALLPRDWREAQIILLATACGLFIAPWLALVCRSVLAAAVFTIAVPGVLAVAGDVAGGIVYGFDRAADIDRFKYLVLWRGMILICALAFVAGWRAFMRLEAIEGRGADLQIPQQLGIGAETATIPRRRHPIRLLIGKEIRLQQISFVVVGLYVATWVTLSWVERSDPTSRIFPLEVLSFLYSALVSLLIGALSSAEERQYGMLDAQRLLPIPAWQQWVVKAGIASGLAVLFAALLPLALVYVSPTTERLVPAFVVIWSLQTLAISLTMVTIGLYVSTLSSSGVRALVASFPAAAGLAVFVRFAGWLIWLAAVRLAGKRFVATPDVTWALAFVAWCSVVWWCGFYNHQSCDRSPRRIAGQVLLILAWTVVLLGVLVLL